MAMELLPVGTSVEKYIFLIDTDQYAGLFVREMAAYCTGFVGECGVGTEQAEKFCEDTQTHTGPDREEWGMFKGMVEKRADDHGVHRPCAVYRTPGFYQDGKGNTSRQDAPDEKYKYPASNSVAIFFTRKPSDFQTHLMMERAKVYAAQPYQPKIKRGKKPLCTVVGFRLLKEVTLVEQLVAWPGGGHE